MVFLLFLWLDGCGWLAFLIYCIRSLFFDEMDCFCGAMFIIAILMRGGGNDADIMNVIIDLLKDVLSYFVLLDVLIVNLSVIMAYLKDCYGLEYEAVMSMIE